jgi:hypothetical protein
MAGPPLVPPRPEVPLVLKSILNSFYEAIRDLRTPGGPSQLVHVDTKANLTGRFPADQYPGGVVICDEINSIVHSTLVSGTWAWKRADGGAL